jgi:hypothetical protein
MQDLCQIWGKACKGLRKKDKKKINTILPEGNSKDTCIVCTSQPRGVQPHSVAETVANWRRFPAAAWPRSHLAETEVPFFAPRDFGCKNFICNALASIL